MRRIFLFAFIGLALVSPAHSEVTMEKKAYGGWPNCIVLSNGTVEAIVITDVGPRIMRYGFIGGQNLLNEYPDMLGKTGGEDWRIYGGHRLWHAPEAKPRTYAPDNSPVKHEWDGVTLRVTQDTEKSTGIQKQMEIALDSGSSKITILHRLTNHNEWDVKLAPWALTVMAKEGRAIYPQEPYIAHDDYLLPARPLVLWHYTDMQDPRWTWGTKYIQLRQDPASATSQKAGFKNARGWAAYTLKGDVFIKRFTHDEDGEYVDFGCSTETFTNADMLEIETLGPLSKIGSAGGTVEHVEEWFLFKAEVGGTDAQIDATLIPLLEQISAGAPKAARK
ncbi:MAG: hypothetical protein SGI88_14190 [Candidatus Hydrogenedentes bacterium]|nr:hypothetical protein [Candidatus Hydrogenedentota bacterium]